MPRVSVVVPALDESAHIEACIRSVLSQRVEGGLEVIVVDGKSSDGTASLAEAAGATVVENPKRDIPSGLNRGMTAARGDVLVRFDAHAEMPPGYIEACVRALDEEEAAVNVGGWREARGVGPWGRATGAALRSRFGVGNARIWKPAEPGTGRHDIEHVPLGCFPARALREAGGWREDLLANEDFELNHRLRLAGGRVVFDPAIWSVYRPRESLRELARQYWRYGRWKGVVLAEHPRSLRPRQLAPVALLGTLALAAAPTPLARLAQAGLTGYALLLAGVAAKSGGGWRTAPVLAAMHVLWGAGLLSAFPVTVARAARRRAAGARA